VNDVEGRCEIDEKLKYGSLDRVTYLEELGIVGTIILKRNLQVLNMSTGFIRLRMWSSGGVLVNKVLSHHVL
jgi:hypothetical protein